MGSFDLSQFPAPPSPTLETTQPDISSDESYPFYPSPLLAPRQPHSTPYSTTSSLSNVSRNAIRYTLQSSRSYTLQSSRSDSRYASTTPSSGRSSGDLVTPFLTNPPSPTANSKVGSDEADSEGGEGEEEAGYAGDESNISFDPREESFLSWESDHASPLLDAGKGGKAMIGGKAEGRCEEPVTPPRKMIPTKFGSPLPEGISFGECYNFSSISVCLVLFLLMSSLHRSFAIQRSLQVDEPGWT
jgi:hypothetical protein